MLNNTNYFYKASSFQKLILIFILTLPFILSGCAARNPIDPYEKLNRATFQLNKGLDCLFIRPVAKVYTKVLPIRAQIMVGNFYQNISEVPNVVNGILQGKFRQASNDAARFIINSTWGILGLFDMAWVRGRLERHHLDFGQTLGIWGYKKSFYIVLPFFGPSTTRDAIGRVANFYLGIWPYIKPPRVSWWLYGIYVVDTRAQYFKVEPVIAEASIDEYAFIRNAYLQNRAYEIGLRCSQPAAGEELIPGPPD